MRCSKCQKDVPLIDNKVGHREDCPHCGADLHTCLNCGFYEPSAYNECLETSADRVVDKEKANYCDLFKPGEGRVAAKPSAADEARRKLEELFAKK